MGIRALGGVPESLPCSVNSVTEYLELEEWTRRDFYNENLAGSIWTAVIGVTQRRRSRFWTNVLSLANLKVGAGTRCMHRSLVLIITYL